MRRLHRPTRHRRHESDTSCTALHRRASRVVGAGASAEQQHAWCRTDEQRPNRTTAWAAAGPWFQTGLCVTFRTTVQRVALGVPGEFARYGVLPDPPLARRRGVFVVPGPMERTDPRRARAARPARSVGPARGLLRWRLAVVTVARGARLPRFEWAPRSDCAAPLPAPRGALARWPGPRRRGGHDRRRRERWKRRGAALAACGQSRCRSWPSGSAPPLCTRARGDVEFAAPWAA